MASFITWIWIGSLLLIIKNVARCRQPIKNKFVLLSREKKGKSNKVPPPRFLGVLRSFEDGDGVILGGALSVHVLCLRQYMRVRLSRGGTSLG
ncbi:unnamed protein product [Lupinus luteus]|uniref:Uncharacterized protein n=1 Tax=Lupinus luteus TaxID=3873 RepID=A0AAV1W714_LUPLU